MEIEVITPGLYTSVQDLGRWGLASYGVPQGGAMDPYLALFANTLIQNQKEDAVLEITLVGPKLRFHGNTRIALAGRGGEIYLNKKKRALNLVITVRKNDELEIKSVTLGCRIYLAVQGGFLTDRILESRSMLKEITPKEKIEKNDRLHTGAIHKINKAHHARVRFAKERYQTNQLVVFPGPEFHQLSVSQKKALSKKTFSLSADSNRMAYPLKEAIQNQLDPIFTGPVLPGTVQLTPAGRLIILMKDCQVTGGYPRVLQVTEQSLIVLAQKKPGEKIHFKTVDF